MTATTEAPGRVVEADDVDEARPVERPAGIPRWRSRDGLSAIAIPSVLLGLHWWLYGRWIEDDAGITFAYARSIATGAGPVLQPGAAPVEGYSNPAWLAIMVVGRWLGLFDHGAWFGVPDLVVFPKLVAFACCVGMFAAFYTAARAVTDRPATVTIVAGSLTALVPSFAIWTTSGLENGLLAVVVLALAATLVGAAVRGELFARRTALICGGLAALAGLTRPDGLIYVAAYPVVLALVVDRARWREGARAVAVSVGVFAVPTGLYLLWRLATFGDWLPNTARAKAQGLPDLAALGRPAEILTYAGWTSGVVAVVLVAAVLRRRSPTRTAVGVLLVPLLLAVVAYAVLGRDWMPQLRYATPVWPLAALAATLAGLALLDGASRMRARIGAAVVVAALVVSGVAWFGQMSTFRVAPTAPMCHVVLSVGRTVNGYADALGIEQGTVLAIDGGGTALTSRLRYVDLAGLADARIAGYWEHHDVRGLDDYVFDVARPTFVQVTPGWSLSTLRPMVTDPRLARDYTLVFSPGNQAGTWVRRDAVRDPALLPAARQWAAATAARIQNVYVQDRSRWTCGPDLRPDVPGQALAGAFPVR